MQGKNDRIAKWSLYGTLGLFGIISLINMLTSLFTGNWQGVVFDLFLPLVGIVLFLLIVGKLPEPYGSLISTLGVSAFIYLITESWIVSLVLLMLLGISSIIDQMVTSMPKREVVQITTTTLILLALELLQ